MIPANPGIIDELQCLAGRIRCKRRGDGLFLNQTMSSGGMMLSSNRQPSVLVIDDDAVCLELTVTVYQRFGCNTYAAQTGRVALDLIGKNPVDLVLLDVHIPGTDTLALLQRISSHCHLHSPPVVVALTGESSTSKLDPYRKAGCTRVLIKPAASVQLLRCLDLVVARVGEYGNHAPLQTREALEALDGDRELLEKLRQSFGLELNEMCPIIDHCIEESDFEIAAEHVHRLAAAAGYSGALVLLNCCRDLEQALRVFDTRAIGKHLSIFQLECRKLSSLL